MMVSEVSLRPGFSKLLILLIGIGLTACSGTPSPERDDNTDLGATPSDVQPGQGLPVVMGLVLEPDGSPVAYALVGSTELTTSEGLMSGTPEAFDSGWIPIEAAGYLTGYTQADYTFNGVDLFETRVTPVLSGILLEESGESVFSIAIPSGYEVSMNIRTSDFNSFPLEILSAGIDIRDVDPRFMPVDSREDLALWGAFGIDAYDQDWNPIDLNSGASLALQIQDGGALSDQAVLASFDPKTGTWKSEGINCSRDEAQSLNCSIERLAPLFGIFDASSSSAQLDHAFTRSWQSDAVGTVSGILVDLLRFDNFFQPPMDDEEENYKNAQADYDQWVNDHGGLDPNDPQAREKLDNFINAARQAAAANQNETGKSHLVGAAAAAFNAGLNDLGSELAGEAADMANELGRKDLEESDCGEFRRLLKRAEQIDLLGGDSAISDQLFKKAQEMAKDCDVWIGRIQVFLRVKHSHPAGLDMSGVTGSLWVERHALQMWTNVDDYVMHGEDKINNIFSTVTYVREDDCRQEIKMYGDPSGATQRVTFEGKYDGYSFQIGEMEPQTGGISIAQTWEFQDKDDEVCVTIMSTQYAFPNYVSVIVHGFEYGSPPITLQDMLDEGSSASTIKPSDTIYGTEKILNPDPDLGKYPFVDGTVTWTFTHTTKKLPLEEQ